MAFNANDKRDSRILLMACGCWVYDMVDMCKTFISKLMEKDVVVKLNSIS